ncbi:MAG: hypothetical protein Fur0022_26040 [Anaerolineales bacterium]
MADKAEARCQMCGKSNPGHLQECQYCGARLKPLIASPSSPQADASGSNWTSASQEDTLGWLRSLGQEEESFSEEAGRVDDLPDWLQSPAEDERKSSAFDWMDEGDKGDPFDSGALNDESNWEMPGSQEHLSQWLPDNAADARSAEAKPLQNFLGRSTPTSNDNDDNDDLPSWLTEEEKTLPLDDFSRGLGKPEDDWLHSIGNEDSMTATIVDWNQQAPSQAPSDYTAAKSDQFDDDLPSWLTSKSASSSEPKTSTEIDFDNDFPDWLDSLSSKTGMTGKLNDMPQWIDENKPSDTDKDSSFDWLATLGDTPDVQPVEDNWDQGLVGANTLASGGALGGLSLDPEDSFISEVGNDETPDWLQGLQEPADRPSDRSREYAGFQSSWGFGNTSEEIRQGAQAASPQEQVPKGEEVGGLPSWVQAFRPIEGADIATEHAEGELERVGPLAGLRDLLTPEADIAKTVKPPSYSDVLQVSATQHANTQLLQALVEAENIPQPSTAPSPLSSQRVMRIVFGVILIAILLFPLISGTEIVPLPLSVPQEIQNVATLSNGAPLDRPILVAFDYEPGLSGELEVATKALFDHWMDRGIPLALVSTSPLGTGLGERQVAYLQSQILYEHTYVYGEDYINLGYIAGGTAGLANFALIPRQTVQMAFDDRPIWELLDANATNPWLSPVMQPINNLSDFYMTVLLTDNPETARNWIEQVEPALRRNSFVVIASAQAEPFIRPYFHHPDPAQRQVEGLLVGLRGGAVFEQMQGQPGAARLYWDALGIGLLVAVGLILIGGSYNYLDTLRHAQRQNRKGKGKKS